MIKYVLYANVNPLEPNTLIKVADSSTFAMGLPECEEHLKRLSWELWRKNYRVSLKRIEETTVKDWNPKKDYFDNDEQ